MSKWSVQEISLSALEISTENPRFDAVSDQRQAIQTMLSDQGQKVFNLAEDIAKDGLNPSELTIVSPHSSEKDRFIVLEGNRRITALKLLHNPDLATAHHQTLLNKFKQLQKGYQANEIKKVSCVVFSDPDEAAKWVKLKHTGENEGVGTVRWDAQQVARFERRASGNSAVALQVLDFLRNSKEVDKETKARLSEVPISNLDRLVTDKNIQELLGISIVDGRLQTGLKEAEIVKGMLKIVRDLFQKKVKVKHIYTKKDREQYIETFKKKEIPQKTDTTISPWELTSKVKTPAATFKPKRSIPLSTARKYIIPRDCILAIREKRINQIYQELKGLNCDEFPNAVAVLLRVFLELSCDVYIAKKKVTGVTKDSKMHEKLLAVATHLEDAGKAEKHELKAVRSAASNQHHFISTNSFNAYIHNKYFNPISKELKLTWDNLQPFIEKLWGEV